MLRRFLCVVYVSHPDKVPVNAAFRKALPHQLTERLVIIQDQNVQDKVPFPVGNRSVRGGSPFGSPMQGCQNRQSMAACTEVLLGAAP